MSNFVELDVVRDPDDSGVIAVITIRDLDSGFRLYSFAIFKEFEAPATGATKRTSYLNERHLTSLRRVTDLVEQRIKTDQDQRYERKRVRR